MKIQSNKFKVRASAGGLLMTNGRGKDAGMGETAKNYCEQWATEQLYNRTKEITTKYMTKGTLQEDLSIDLVADQLNLGLLLKNEQHFKNKFMTGTPDIVLSDLVIDVKSSWDVFTFPRFASQVPVKNKGYITQLQIYMALTKRKKAKLAYCLVDTPRHLIESEATRHCYDMGHSDLDPDVYEQFEKRMTYQDIDPSERIKVFDIERDDALIKAIEARVKEAREYLAGLK